MGFVLVKGASICGGREVFNIYLIIRLKEHLQNTTYEF